jgi:hypothetical protein
MLTWTWKCQRDMDWCHGLIIHGSMILPFLESHKYFGWHLDFHFFPPQCLILVLLPVAEVRTQTQTLILTQHRKAKMTCSTPLTGRKAQKIGESFIANICEMTNAVLVGSCNLHLTLCLPDGWHATKIPSSTSVPSSKLHWDHGMMNLMGTMMWRSKRIIWHASSWSNCHNYIRLSPEQREYYTSLFNIIRQVPGFTNRLQEIKKCPGRLDILSRVVSTIFSAYMHPTDN